ncbi:hypothetical protein D3C80_1420440 [compost metagenome]
MDSLHEPASSFLAHLCTVIVQAEIDQRSKFRITPVNGCFILKNLNSSGIPAFKGRLAQPVFCYNERLVRMIGDDLPNDLFLIQITVPGADIVIPHQHIACPRSIGRRLKLQRIAYIVHQPG